MCFCISYCEPLFCLQFSQGGGFCCLGSRSCAWGVPHHTVCFDTFRLKLSPLSSHAWGDLHPYRSGLLLSWALQVVECHSHMLHRTHSWFSSPLRYESEVHSLWVVTNMILEADSMKNWFLLSKEGHDNLLFVYVGIILSSMKKSWTSRGGRFGRKPTWCIIVTLRAECKLGMRNLSNFGEWGKSLDAFGLWTMSKNGIVFFSFRHQSNNIQLRLSSICHRWCTCTRADGALVSLVRWIQVWRKKCTRQPWGTWGKNPPLGCSSTRCQIWVTEVLGALLLGARHSAGWPDAFGQDHRHHVGTSLVGWSMVAQWPLSAFLRALFVGCPQPTNALIHWRELYCGACCCRPHVTFYFRILDLTFTSLRLAIRVTMSHQ